MAEPNPKIRKSRPRVPNSPKDGGVYDLPKSMARDSSVPAGQDAAEDIDPAIQPNRFPVDGYSVVDAGFPVPLS